MQLRLLCFIIAARMGRPVREFSGSPARSVAAFVHSLARRCRFFSSFMYNCWTGPVLLVSSYFILLFSFVFCLFRYFQRVSSVFTTFHCFFVFSFSYSFYIRFPFSFLCLHLFIRFHCALQFCIGFFGFSIPFYLFISFL